METKTFSTLQVSFGQLNFVSKRMEKSENNKPEVSKMADKTGVTSLKRNKQKTTGITSTALMHT